MIKDVWESVIPECHPLDYERLLAIQKTMASQFSFFYVVLKNEEGQIIGLQYFQYLPFRSIYFDSPLKKYRITRDIEKMFIDKRFAMLICGSLFSVNAPGYFFCDNSLSSNKKYQLLLQSADILMRSLNKCELIFKDVDESMRNYFSHNNFNAFDDDVTMTMPIKTEWVSFSDYLADLKHKYAQRARKIIKAASVIERRELSFEEIEKHQIEINKLFHQVVNNQAIRLGIPDADYFIEMKKMKPDSFSICGYFLNNQLVAFASYIVNHKNDELHYIGFDYNLNKTYYLYFNILFDGISKAIQNKIDVLELGRTAREAKAVVGAVPINFHSYILFSSGLSKWIYSQLKKRFHHKTETDLKSRHPFKDNH